MSKLDQLKALGDAKRASRKLQSRSSQAEGATSDLARVGPAERHKAELRASKLKVPKSTSIPFQGGAGKGSAAARTDVLQTVGATASVRSGSKLKRGRPKITDKRPWEQEGMSRRTWYRRKAEEKK